MAKHLIDLDEAALDSARSELGTSTIRDTVNQSLRLASSARSDEVGASLDILALAELDDRGDAWR